MRSKYLIFIPVTLLIIYFTLTLSIAEENYANRYRNKKILRRVYTSSQTYTLYVSNVPSVYEPPPVFKTYNPHSTADMTVQEMIDAGIKHIDPYEEYYEKLNKYYEQNNIMITDTCSKTSSNIIGWPYGPFFIDMSSNGILYVADCTNKIKILDTKLHCSLYAADMALELDTGSSIVCDIILSKSEDFLFYSAIRSSSSSLGIINTETNSLIKSIKLSSEGWCYGLAIDYKYIYAAIDKINAGGEILFVNLNDYTIEDIITIDKDPFSLEITPDGKKLYIVNSSSNDISVVDTIKRNISATIKAEENPRGIAITPDGNRVFITNLGSDSVSVIDVKTDTLINTINVGEEPINVAISEDGKRAFVTNSKSGNITVIDADKNIVIDTIPSSPQALPCDIIVAPLNLY